MDDRQPVSFIRRALSYVICCLVAVQPILPAVAAEITPVTPGTKLDAAGNGVPVVNIATPNQAGVSHNQYQQYNVGKEGLILNNATGRLTQTQLGGLIQNNPNLKAGQEARTIINEVVGANRSQLQGYTEVGGNAANVMVANPYGITCNGCGFINTPGVTLTTGKPQLDANGNLAALEVSKGSVIVEGQGLDGSSADAVSIVARATEINAGIYAKDLSVTTGANRVGQDGSVTPIAGEGAAPAVSVDTGALGGMYANRIHLVSSEKGVGVNLGNLVAKQGDITLSANGRLTLGNAKASDNLSVAGQEVALHDKQQAGQNLAISSSGRLTLDQVTASSGNTLSLRGTDIAVNQSALQAGADKNGNTLQDRQLSVTGNNVAIRGSSLNGGNVAINGNTALSQDKTSALKAQQTLSIYGKNTTLAGANGGRVIRLTGQDFTASSDSQLTADDTLQASLDGMASLQGELTAGNGITLHAAHLQQSGTIATKQADVSATTLNNSGKWVVDNNLSLITDGLNNSGSLIASALQVQSGDVQNDGAIQGTDSLSITNQHAFVQGDTGELLSTGTLSLSGDDFQTAGKIQGNQVSLSGKTWQNSAWLNALGDASLATTTFNNTGNLVTGGDLDFNTQSFANHGLLQAAQQINLQADNAVNSGHILAQDLSASGQMLTNSGLLQGNAALDLQVANQFTQMESGQMLSGGTAAITAQEANTAGALQAQNLNWQGDSWTNTANVLASDSLSVTLGDQLQNDGILKGQTSLLLSTARFNNDGDLLSGNVVVRSAEVKNQGTILGDDSDIQAQSLENNGLIQGNNTANLAVTGKLEQSQPGRILSGGTLALSAPQAVLSGEIQADSLSVQGDSWQNNGKILSLHDSQYDLAKALNNSGTLYAQDALRLSTPQFTNTGSLSAALLSINSEDIKNQGLLQTTGDADITSKNRFNQLAGGQLLTGGTLTLTTPEITNAGLLQANVADLAGNTLQNDGQILLLDSGKVAANAWLINNGKLLAADDLLLKAPVLNNTGTLQAGKLESEGNSVNNSGVLTGINTLALQADGVITNQGTLQSKAAASLHAPQLNNTGKILAQDMVITGDGLTNSGTLTAQHGLTLNLAQSIDNQSGGHLLSTGSAALSTARMSNAGSVQSSGNLGILLSEKIANAGQLQSADGVLTLNANGVDNQGTLAGKGITINAPTITNNGLIQGENSLALNSTQSIINNSGGQLLTNGAAGLQAATVSNSGWLQGNNLTLTAGRLDQNGTALAGAALVIHAIALNNGGTTQGNTVAWDGSSLDNSGTLLGLSKLALQASQINNRASGRLWSTGALDFITASLQQQGQLLAQENMTGTVNGPFQLTTTLAAGGNLTLTVNGDFTQNGQLQGQGVVVKSGGTLTNNGSITAGVGDSVLQAGNLQLNGSGSVQAGGNLTLTSAGALTNLGFVGTLGSLTAQAASLLQNSSLLYAAGDMKLFSSSLQNLGGDILAGNDLTIARDGAGNRSAELLNRSGNIETRAGDISLNTDLLQNERAGLSVTQVDSALPIPAWASDVKQAVGAYTYSYVEIPLSWFQPGDYGLLKEQIQVGHGHGDDLFKTAYFYVPYKKANLQTVAIASKGTQVSASGNIARISSGRDISGYTGQLNNIASSVAASGNISLSGNQLNNLSYQGGTTTEYQTFQNRSDEEKWPELEPAGNGITGTNQTITYRVYGAPIYETVSTDGEFNASIQAGGAINANFTGDISNTSLKPNNGTGTSILAAPTIKSLNNPQSLQVQSRRQLISTPGLTQGDSVTSQQVNGAALNVGNGTNLRDQLAQNIAHKTSTLTLTQLADYPLPSGENGLFVMDSNKSSRYLIHTNPRLDKLGQLDNSLFADLSSMTGTQPASQAVTETRPQYTDVNQFLGSDYLLGKLNLNADNDYRFLGDAAFDTRYVSNAVLSQTGQRYLGGMGTDLSQMQYLMDNAAAEQKSLNLTLGLSLSAAQIANLDRSIVWWEDVTVDGQTVLAPHLYLAQADKDNIQGSSIVAGSVALESGGTVNNSGLIKGASLVNVNANSIINQSEGTLASDGSLALTAVDDISNLSSTIRGMDVSLSSLNGDVINKTQVTEWKTDGKTGKVLTSAFAYSHSVASPLATISANNLSINAGHDIENQGASLRTTGDMSLQAGNNISLTANTLTDSSYREQTFVNVSRSKNASSETIISGSNVTAGGSLVMQSGHDINIKAGTVDAAGNVALAAGNDINLQSAATSQSSSQGKRETHSSGLARTTLTSGGDLTLAAGRDVNSQAAGLVADRDVTLEAGRDVNLQAAQTTSGSSNKGGKKTEINESVRQQGTEIASGGNTAITAGRDVTSQAAQVTATQDVAVNAGRDLNLGTATESDYSYKEETKSKGGFLKKTTTHTIKESSDTAEKGTLLSGNGVTLNAGNNLLVKGSSVVGDNDVTLKAGNNVDIVAATNTDASWQLSEKKKSGLMSSGGIGFTIGSSSTRQELREKGTTQSQSASTVGSTGGNLTVTAGGQAHVGGSDLIAGKNMTLTGDSVTIDPGHDKRTSDQSFEQKSSGLTVALSGAVGSAINGAVSTAQAAAKQSDGRLAALQGVQSALSGVQAEQASRLSKAQGDKGSPEFGVSLSIGGQSSKSTSHSEQDTTSGSTLSAGKNLTVTATGKGNGASSGDIVMVGAKAKVGQDLTLDAQRDILLSSGQDTQLTTGKNESKGGSLGVGLMAGGQSTGLSVSASANSARGNEKGNGLKQNETVLDAGGRVALNSGRDTTLSGAQVSGEQITGDIGRNLTLSSLQNSDNYKSSQQSVSAGLGWTFGTGSGTASFSYNRDKMHSTYDSVQEQTGLFAGGKGFDLKVGEHTQLDGAVIASTADATQNRLDTGTLGFDDIHNQADYKVEHQGISFSTSGTLGSLFLGNAASSVLAAAGSNGHAEGVTQAAVSNGTITIRDQANQQQDVATLSRDAANANNSISPIFDKEKEQKRLQTAQLVGEIASQAMNITTTEAQINATTAANAKVENVSQSERNAVRKALQDKDPTKVITADDVTGRIYSDAYETALTDSGWQTGGKNQRAMQAAAAVIQGLAGGDIKAAIAGGAAPYIAHEIGSRIDDAATKVIAHAVVNAALAAAQDRNMLAAAGGAATGELVGMLAGSIYHKNPSELTEQERTLVSTFATLASGLAGGLIGDSGADTVTAAAAGKNTVENNALGGLDGFGKGMADYVQAQGSLVNNTNLTDENGKILNPATPEQIKYASDKLVTGELPEGANITEVIVNGYKDGVLIAGAAYLGPAVSVGKVVGGAVIAEIANGTYQWFDLSRPGNENKTWDYKGSISTGITGALAPGRGVWQNVGIAAGGAVFTDGPDIGSVGAAALGAWAGGKFGELAPFPGEVNDLFGGIGGEIISNKVKDKINEN